MRTVVASGNDALNILFEAANASGQEENTLNNTNPLLGDGSNPRGLKAEERVSPRIHEIPMNVDSIPQAIPPVVLSEATDETLQIWEACRFVRMGWFTAREAVTFIDL